ncbi:HigA family addiction module antitoxin [Vogesella urethralis]|uniref:HigA family addiction module antitoxin n=1 Tax=Vogesella urethralis TaxID=2592656 RepID=UPI0011863365|nr:HigA family addiction module antitoxin [Vogesella urethralis]
MARHPLNTRTPIAPGRFLYSRFLRPAGLTQTDAASQLGLSRRRLNEIIQGHRSITPDTALRLSRLFGLPPRFWLDLQGDWDLAQARRKFCTDTSASTAR